MVLLRIRGRRSRGERRLSSEPYELCVSVKRFPDFAGEDAGSDMTYWGAQCWC